MQYRVDEEDEEDEILNGFAKYFSSNSLIAIIEKLAVQIIKANTWTSDISNRPQILKYRDVFHMPNHANRDRWAIYNNTTNSAEFREVILLVESIKLRILRIRNRFNPPSIEESEVHSDLNSPRLECSLLSPYSKISSQYLRIMEFKYRNDMYYYLIVDKMKLGWLLNKRIQIENSNYLSIDKSTAVEEILNIKVSDLENPYIKHYKSKMKAVDPESVTGIDFVSFIVREALFCNLVIIQAQRLFGIDYISNFIHLASAHERMGNWCVALENLESLFGEKFIRANKIRLKAKLGSDAIYYLEPNYQYEQAIQSYYNGIQTHCEGKAYRDQIHNFYFLEDDFNDNLSHFAISMERLRINTGFVREKIRGLSKKRNDSRLYNLREYYPETFEEE